MRLNAFAAILSVVAALTAQPALAGNPFGNFEEAEWDVGQAPQVRLSGWALDPDTSAPIDVHVYLNGNFVTSTTANWHRPDVGSAYPGSGDYHGFLLHLSKPEFEGDGELCVYGINVGDGNENSLIGCRTIAARRKTVQVCESSHGIDAGLALFHRDDVTISASGTIWAGVLFTGWNDANGWSGWTAGSSYPKPGENQYSLLGSFAGTPGSWWFVGTYDNWELFSDRTPSTLYFRINDDVPNNGDGCFTVRITASYGNWP